MTDPIILGDLQLGETRFYACPFTNCPYRGPYRENDFIGRFLEKIGIGIKGVPSVEETRPIYIQLNQNGYVISGCNAIDENGQGENCTIPQQHGLLQKILVNMDLISPGEVRDSRKLLSEMTRTR